LRRRCHIPIIRRMRRKRGREVKSISFEVEERGMVGRRVVWRLGGMGGGCVCVGVGVFVEDMCVRLLESAVGAFWGERREADEGDYEMEKGGALWVESVGCCWWHCVHEIFFSVGGRPYGEVRYTVTVVFFLSRASLLC
jgi:hypothetical protein